MPEKKKYPKSHRLDVNNSSPQVRHEPSTGGHHEPDSSRSKHQRQRSYHEYRGFFIRPQMRALNPFSRSSNSHREQDTYSTRDREPHPTSRSKHHSSRSKNHREQESHVPPRSKHQSSRSKHHQEDDDHNTKDSSVPKRSRSTHRHSSKHRRPCKDSYSPPPQRVYSPPPGRQTSLHQHSYAMPQMDTGYTRAGAGKVSDPEDSYIPTPIVSTRQSSFETPVSPEHRRRTSKPQTGYTDTEAGRVSDPEESYTPTPARSSHQSPSPEPVRREHIRLNPKAQSGYASRGKHEASPPEESHTSRRATRSTIPDVYNYPLAPQYYRKKHNASPGVTRMTHWSDSSLTNSIDPVRGKKGFRKQWHDDDETYEYELRD